MSKNRMARLETAIAKIEKLLAENSALRKPRLVIAEQETCRGTAEDGMWMARLYDGRPLLTRKTKQEAVRNGLKFALSEAGSLNADLSRFHVETP